MEEQNAEITEFIRKQKYLLEMEHLSETTVRSKMRQNIKMILCTCTPMSLGRIEMNFRKTDTNNGPSKGSTVTVMKLDPGGKKWGNQIKAIVTKVSRNTIKIQGKATSTLMNKMLEENRYYNIKITGDSGISKCSKMQDQIKTIGYNKYYLAQQPCQNRWKKYREISGMRQQDR